MKYGTGVLGGIALLALLQAAPAAPLVPKVAGKYAYSGTTLCQAVLLVQKNIQKDAVINVNTAYNGELAARVGYINFLTPAAGAINGEATFTSTGFEGSNLRVNGNGSSIKPFSDNVTGQFFVTATTLVIDGILFNMTFADVANGIARTLHLVRRDDATCVTRITATKQ